MDSRIDRDAEASKKGTGQADKGPGEGGEEGV